ncbi:hypothetical protein ACIPUP_07460 [Pectobacterium actinidiae]|uniref:Uncharacterized protein n=1 Tax=Pectobacterium actinidiae TaxID=1507808 RepID=A0ABW8GBW6_9GAMM
MKEKQMLASISADTSRIEEKVALLLKVLPERVSDEFRGVVTSLFNNIVFVDSPVTVGASGSLDIICILDFDTATYNQVISTARAFEADLTHE